MTPRDKEMDVPEIPTSPMTAQSSEETHHRFLGCLLGGAVGDALGAPVEFMQRHEILARFGDNGITDYAPAYGRLGAITDDTQMTLFTAEGLLRSYVRGYEKGIVSHESMTANAYLRWLSTQGIKDNFRVASAMQEPGWLVGHPELHHHRAPGNTCLAALRSMSSPGAPATNDSKGCGGVMRMAPVGLYVLKYRSGEDPQLAFQLGRDLAALTHGHPSGSLPAGVLAVLVMALAGGASLSAALATALACLRLETGHEETLDALELAASLATSEVPTATAIGRLGQGWVAEEALAIAVYCAMKAKSFREGVINAVNHDGDSDSTGAIAGNLLGAMYGVNAIPDEWLEGLELRSVITEIADDLYAFQSWRLSDEIDSDHERVWRKYPGC